MRHADDETLGLIALGEPAPAGVQEHLERCARCAAELTRVRRVVEVARDSGLGQAATLDVTTGTPAPPIAPPPAVWDRIAAATGVAVAARPAEVERHATGASPVFQAAIASGGRAAGSRPDRYPSRRRRVRRVSTLSLAAASMVLGVLLGGAGTWFYQSQRPATGAGATVVAATSLTGLPLAPQAAGRADVIETAQGRVLDVDVSRLGDPAGFYEVWLIDPTVTKMVAVGVLNGETGRFVLPPGVSLAGYPIVDVSVQPLNGNPKHSGRSVLRGTLRS